MEPTTCLASHNGSRPHATQECVPRRGVKYRAHQSMHMDINIFIHMYRVELYIYIYIEKMSFMIMVILSLLQITVFLIKYLMILYVQIHTMEVFLSYIISPWTVDQLHTVNGR